MVSGEEGGVGQIVATEAPGCCLKAVVGVSFYIAPVVACFDGVGVFVIYVVANIPLILPNAVRGI